MATKTDGGSVATATEGEIEIVVPEGMEDILDAATGAPVRLDGDRLPTDIEGAFAGDETIGENVPALAPEPVAAATPAAEPVVPSTEPAAEVVASPPLDPRASRHALEAQADLDRIDEEIELGRKTMRAAAPIDAETEMSDEDWGKLQAKVVEKAGEAQDFGQAVNEVFSTLREIDKQKAVTRASKQTFTNRNAALTAMTEAARERHPDFDAIVTDSGIWAQAHLDSPTKDPAISKLVYSAIDPAEKAYWLGRTKIARANKRDPSDPDFAKPIGAPVAAAVPAAVPAVVPAVVPDPEPAPGTPAAIRRDATRATVDKLAATSTRGRGVDTFTPAGRPTTTMSIERLDRLQEQNPEAYQRLITANPGLGDAHMMGDLTQVA
jgi:hypothetical protein